MSNLEIYELITKGIPKKNILTNESMKKHTSFKIGGNADFYVRAKNIEEIKYILNMSNENNIPLTIIGNGSNLLVKDNGIKGIVLRIDIDNIDIEKTDLSVIEKIYNINNIKLQRNFERDYTIVTVGSGVLLGKLAQILLKNSIAGFEFASGIPGTIGGAVKMNAGAYGSEFKDIVIETICIDRKGNIVKLNNLEQEFEYRTSIYKNKEYIILQTKLLLKHIENSEEIKIKMDEYKKSRIEKQPIEFPSAGSTFKRGSDFITAKLIDDCGLKGYKIGDAQVSTKHAGFVINTGNATASDVLKLVDYIKKCVFDKFGKNIELEIEVVGN